MKTISKHWIKRLTEEEMYPEPENAPISYIDDLVTHYDFAQFLKNLGFKYLWTALPYMYKEAIHQASYECRKKTTSNKDNIEQIFGINIHTLDGDKPSNKLAFINAAYTLTRYSRIKHGLKFNVNYSAFIPPAIPNSVYVYYTAKDFVLNVLALMEKITPEQSYKENTAIIREIDRQFKEIHQP